MNSIPNLEKVFDIFNNSVAKIGTVSQGDGYLDEDVSFDEIGSCEGDFQPYNGTAEKILEGREYGLFMDASAVFYSRDPDGLLAVGRVAMIEQKTYDILSVWEWELGKVASLKERVN